MDYHTPTHRCRSCGGTKFSSILDLGNAPLADGLVSENQLAETDITAPLELIYCHHCSLVQLSVSVDPTVLFQRDYPYFSSVNPALIKHFGESAQKIIEKRSLDGDALVIEAASNDGYMLQNFVAKGIPVLGIDPAGGPAAAAKEKGIETLNEFFSETLALKLKEAGKSADVFLANNVLAHVPDLLGFTAGIRHLLKPDGVAIIEVPYLRNLIEQGEFDTIYHQHLCYFSVIALQNLFNRQGLYLNDIQQLPIHGGSLRLFVDKRGDQQASVKKLIEEEMALGLNGFDYYQGFQDQVKQFKERFTALIAKLKSENATIAGYGAAAKATTLLSYCGLASDAFDYIVDLNENKHGKYMPGCRIPILPTSVLEQRKPDYLVILAWNFAKEIMAQQQAYTRNGGKFVVPIPEIKII